MIVPLPGVGKIIGIFSSSSFPQFTSWTTKDFIKAHNAVRESGKFNFEECRIPIPTKIRYDRIREALGKDITPKEEKVIDLLKYGMPINCKTNFGVQKLQKNHFSALSHKKAIDEYLSQNVQCKASVKPVFQSSYVSTKGSDQAPCDSRFQFSPR